MPRGPFVSRWGGEGSACAARERGCGSPGWDSTARTRVGEGSRESQRLGTWALGTKRWAGACWGPRGETDTREGRPARAAYLPGHLGCPGSASLGVLAEVRVGFCLAAPPPGVNAVCPPWGQIPPGHPSIPAPPAKKGATRVCAPGRLFVGLRPASLAATSPPAISPRSPRSRCRPAAAR